MSSLNVYHEANGKEILFSSTDPKEMTAKLDEVGVLFDQWTATKEFASDATQEEIIAAYTTSVEKLRDRFGFTNVDVIHLGHDHPKKVPLRQQFLEEHTHTEDEIRFFVGGEGLFFLHLGEHVYVTHCVRGDLISVPANTPHWFDLGTQPELTAIRFFHNPDGWVAHPTNSGINKHFDVLPFRPKALLLDIEGTIGSISFVRDVLFPYARKELNRFVAEQGHEPAVAQILAEAKNHANNPEMDNQAIVGVMEAWIDEDQKITPLKELQGLIWESGYRRGDFKAHLYQDAFDQMKAWKDAGKELFIYSSGSVKAQQLFFEHTVFGDLRSWFRNCFDTHMGSKKEIQSYERIAAEMGYPVHEILFFSDVTAELDAAQEAGMSTVWLVRDPVEEKSHHDAYTSFEQIPIV